MHLKANTIFFFNDLSLQIDMSLLSWHQKCNCIVFIDTDVMFILFLILPLLRVLTGEDPYNLFYLQLRILKGEFPIGIMFLFGYDI